jgi:hypothetical protein
MLLERYTGEFNPETGMGGIELRFPVAKAGTGRGEIE